MAESRRRIVEAYPRASANGFPASPASAAAPESSVYSSPPPSLLSVGGCRSGKSALAQAWAERHPGPWAFIATADPGNDPEMMARVARHQAARGPEWRTLVALREPVPALREAASGCGAAVFDCVTVWLSNLMMLHPQDEPVLDAVRELAAELRRPPLPVALVSGETGQGVVPLSAVARRFRDLQGEANQILAAACSSVVFSVCGLPRVLKGVY